MKTKMDHLRNFLKVFYSVFFTLVITALFIYSIRVTILETLYQLDPTDENLIRLSTVLLTAEDYEKSKYYLPQAAEVDNSHEISRCNEYYMFPFYLIGDHQMASHMTYLMVATNGNIVYLADEDYDGYREVFPEFYEKIIDEKIYLTWLMGLEVFYEKNDDSYEIVIELLEEECPERPAVSLENEDEILEYRTNLHLRSYIHELEGDLVKVKELNDEELKLGEELAELKGEEFNESWDLIGMGDMF